MKISCPGCAKMLSLPDNLGGKRVKCPACQEVFRVPEASTAVTTPAAKPASAQAAAAPAPAKKSPAQPQPTAVKKTPPALKPAQKTCPECGEMLAANASQCSLCGWASDQAAVTAARPASRRSAPVETEGGRCYVDIRNDEVDLTPEIRRRLKKFIETEQLDLQLMDDDELPPEELTPDDVLISGKVDWHDYGSRFMRYWLTFISMFGPGSCRLEVTADIETADAGSTRVKSRVRQWIGVFGGSGPGLMKRNVQIVSGQIATKAARHVTGRKFLNASAYTCGYWSLGLGIASLTPCIGPLLSLISFVLGLVAFVTIKKRKLPRGKGVALTGMLLAFFGFFVSVVLSLYVMQP